MKKKALLLLLSLSCCLSMTACGGSTETTNETLVNKDAFAEESSTSEESKTVEESETEIDTETETESKAESETETKEEKTSPSSASTPSTLSDNLYDFQVSIDGVVYQVPMWYSDFEALGWEFDGDNTETLASNQYTLSNRWKKDGSSVYTRIANLTLNSASYADCMIASLTLDSYDLKDCDWEILLPGNIQYGVSNADDIKAAYGDPSSDYEGSMYYKMTYKYDNYREISLYVDNETNVINKIEIENIVELEGGDNSIDETVPDVVKNYTAPSSLGDDLYSFHFELEGNLYVLPCPVSELLANGFTINESRSASSVGAGNVDWVELKYNNQTLRSLVRNYADYATVIENCFVLSVESSDFDPDFALTIPCGIKRGDSEADVEKAIADFNYEKETSDSGFTYYTIYDPNGSKLDNYSLVIKEGVVISIEVDHD